MSCDLGTASPSLWRSLVCGHEGQELGLRRRQALAKVLCPDDNEKIWGSL